MKTPGNAKTPCRFCHIRAKRAPNGHYYVPHNDFQTHRGGLCLRNNLRAQIELSIDAGSQWADRVGVTRKSILLRLPSLHFPRSFTIDLMHCILLNTIKNIWKVWDEGNTGSNDDNDNEDGPQAFYVGDHDKDIISNVLRMSRFNVPAALGTLPQNLEHFRQFKAAEWKTVLELYGPSLLYEHIALNAWKNFRDLCRIWITAINYRISNSDVVRLKNAIADFVRDYEKIYHAGDPERLPACSINIHWLLHLPACIEDNGPSRYWWSFPLERYCYEVKQTARSKSHMGISMANMLIRIEQYNIVNLLQTPGVRHPDLTDQHQRFPVLNSIIAKPHHHPHLPLNRRLRRRLAQDLNRPTDDSLATDLQYYRRCKLTTEVTIGSGPSQYDSEINRNNHFVCYRPPGRRCRFGTVYGFIQVQSDDFQYALVQKWEGVAADLDADQITYSREDGRWELIRVAYIRCLVGVLTEFDIHLPSRATKMIIGALGEVRSSDDVE